MRLPGRSKPKKPYVKPAIDVLELPDGPLRDELQLLFPGFPKDSQVIDLANALRRSLTARIQHCCDELSLLECTKLLENLKGESWRRDAS